MTKYINKFVNQQTIMNAFMLKMNHKINIVLHFQHVKIENLKALNIKILIVLQSENS